MIEKLSCIVNPRSSPSSAVAAMSTKLGRWLHRSRKTRHGQALLTEPHSQQEGCRTEEGSNSLSRDRTSGSQMGGFVQHGLMYAFASQVLSYLFSDFLPPPPSLAATFSCVIIAFVVTNSCQQSPCLCRKRREAACHPVHACRIAPYHLAVTSETKPASLFHDTRPPSAPLLQPPVPFSQNSRQSHLAVACNPAAVSRRAQGCGDKAILLV